jgi:hypothetical protein
VNGLLRPALRPGEVVVERLDLDFALGALFGMTGEVHAAELQLEVFALFHFGLDLGFERGLALDGLVERRFDLRQFLGDDRIVGVRLFLQLAVDHFLERVEGRALLVKQGFEFLQLHGSYPFGLRIAMLRRMLATTPASSSSRGSAALNPCEAIAFAWAFE